MRSRFRSYFLAGAAIAVAAALLLSKGISPVDTAARSPMAISPDARRTELPATAPRAEAANANVPSSRVSTILAPGAKAALVLRDRVSDIPLAHVKIRTPAGDELGETDFDGVLNLARNDVDLARAPLLAKLTEDFGEAIVPIDVARRANGAVVEATAPAYARLEVRVRPPKAGDLADVVVSVPQRGKMVEQLMSLVRRSGYDLKTSAGRDFAKEARRQTLVHTSEPVERTDEMARFVVDVPFDGNAAVRIHAWERVLWRRLVSVERGEVKGLDAEVLPLPIVAGVVVTRDGTPVFNQAVKVLCRRTLSEDEAAACDPDELSQPRPDSGAIESECEALAVTDALGRFEVTVPFTNDVWVYSTRIVRDECSMAGSARRTLVSSSEAVTDVRLVLASPTTRLKVRFLYADGTPRSGGVVTFLPDFGPESLSTFWMITDSIDVDGWCDLSLARRDGLIRARFSGQSSLYCAATCDLRDGQEIRTGAKPESQEK